MVEMNAKWPLGENPHKEQDVFLLKTCEVSIGYNCF